MLDCLTISSRGVGERDVGAEPREVEAADAVDSVEGAPVVPGVDARKVAAADDARPAVEPLLVENARKLFRT